MLRIETKYPFDKNFTDTVRGVVSTIFSVDQLFPRGIVNSIYFDTYDLFSACQTFNGEQFRAKIRYRFYDNDSNNGYLEVKFKYALASSKVRVNCSLNDVLSYSLLDLIGKDIGCIKELNAVILSRLNPICQVNYKRSRYISLFSKIRLSVDTEIESFFINNDTRRAFNMNTISLDKNVLEVKREPEDRSAEIEEDRLRTLLLLKKSAFSKYANSIHNLIGE